MTEIQTLVPTNFGAALALAGPLGANLTSTGLTINDPDLPYENWENLGRVIGFAGNAWQWWAGDWINIGEKLFGEQAAQGQDDQATRYDIVRRTIGKEQQTLLNIASVARNVKAEVRRPELGFSHHAVVAPFHEDPEQQAEWLRLAVENQWSVAELRQAIRDAKSPGEPEPDAEPGGGGSDTLTHCEVIERAARLVFSTWQTTPDGEMLVPRESAAQLMSALGEQ